MTTKPYGQRVQSDRRRRRGIALVLAGASLVTLIGFAAGAITSGLNATPATAHAILQSTEPGAGSTVTRPPGSVTLHFDEQVEVSFGSVRVYNTNASRVDEGHPSHPAGDSHAVRLALPRLVDGSYVVTWRVISADSHPVHGAFTFRIGTGQASDTTSLTRRLPGCGRREHVGRRRIRDRPCPCVRVGPCPDRRHRVPPGRVAGRPRQPAGARGAVGRVVRRHRDHRVRDPVAGALCRRAPFSKLGDSSIVSSVLDTRFGKVWLARAIVLVVLAPMLRALIRSNDRPPAPALMAAAGVGGVFLASSFGLASHPGTGSQVPLAVFADTSHVSAASVWIGGLVLLTVCVLAGRAVPNAGSIVRRFSPVAFWAVAAIVASGLYQSWREVGSIDALKHTTYGHLLVIKVLLVVGLIALAFDQSTVGEPAPPRVASCPDRDGRYAGSGWRRSAIRRRPRHRRTGCRRRRAGPAHTSGAA